MSFFKKIPDLLPYIFIFIGSLYQPWDTDLGWHLKYGEYFFKHGQILKENIFSTQMPDFIWANTSWGVDLIYYWSFTLGGFLGVTILAAIVITATFYFFSKASELDFWQKAIIFPAILFLEEPVNEVSFRGQVLSGMFLGILFLIISRVEKLSKIKFLLWVIPLFFIWANIHGQFILGLGILILWILSYIFSGLILFAKNNKQNSIAILFFKFINLYGKNLLFIFGILFLAFLATLINPYGIGIYSDAFLHFNNPNLQDIMEYLPLDKYGVAWWGLFYFGLFLACGVFYSIINKHFTKLFPYMTVSGILYGLSWAVRRYTWSMFYISIPILKPLTDFIRPKKEKVSQMLSIILFAIYISYAVYTKLPLSQFTDMNWQLYCHKYNNCSPLAVQFIKDNNLQNNLFSLYGWGGYMIWNFPDVKPSIDGRMHLWVDSTGYSAFNEYYKIEQNRKDINETNYQTALVWKEKPVYKRLTELTDQGVWKKVYEDDSAGVFVRNKQAGSELLLNP